MISRVPLLPLAPPFAALALAGGAACSPSQEPPGRVVSAAIPVPALAVASTEAPLPAAPPPPPRPATEPGGGARLTSIAMRTWIYQEPRSSSTKLGYLRAGGTIARGDAPVGTDGCPGGWFRVAPRGHVCAGAGATLEPEHVIAQATGPGPRRGEPFPYRYVISRAPPPHLYFRVPNDDDQRRVEGEELARHLATRPVGARDPNFAELGPPDPLPPLLASGGALPKPYGAVERLRFSVHAGRAAEDSAFGLLSTYQVGERRFGLTTELDLIPIDRTRIVKPTAFRGLPLEPDDALPVAFVIRRGATLFRLEGEGTPREALREGGPAPFRSGHVLTGRRQGELLEAKGGGWLPSTHVVVATPREDPAGFAESGRKWIDISIEKQTLVAYEGRRAVYATLVSTGLGGTGNPKKTPSTVRGTFMIHAKHVAATMDGDEASDDAYQLHDVPYVQYFHENYALHGAYWHDEFGKMRSHGCVNLAPADAAWLFEWTEPHVPPDWHGAMNLEAGTLVYTHR